jgi:hypothetical protein
MRFLAIPAIAMLLVGCASPVVVYRHPGTGEERDCTRYVAERMPATLGAGGSTQPGSVDAMVRAWDQGALMGKCMAEAEKAGFVRAH